MTSAPDAEVTTDEVTGADRFATDELVRLRRAVESTSDLITFHARSGQLLFANRAAREFIGISAEDPLPRFGMHEFFETTPDLETEMRQAIIESGRWAGELDIVGADDRIRVSVVVSGHRDASGRYEYFSVLSRDVSEQRAGEAARRRIEHALRAVVQSSPLPIVALDARGTVHVWNRASESLFGWSADEVIGGAPPFIVDTHEFEELTARAFAGETVHSSEARFFRREGPALDVNVSVAPLRNASGRVVSVVVVVADVSDQRRAEVALRASEERMRALLANISDVVTVIAADGHVQYTSPTAERVYGYADGTQTEIQSIFETVHPDDRDRMLAIWEKSRLTPGEFQPLELRVRKGDGSWMYLEAIANNLLDDPSVNGIVVTSRDITGRKESEEALRASESELRESESRYRAVVDDQTELVCRYLPDATLTFANRAFAEFFGSSSEELRGAKLVDLRPAPERVRTLERLGEFTARDSLRSRVEREVALDGSPRWYEWTDRAFVNDAGEVVEFQSVGHDITDQRRAAEFTMRQAEILEQIARGVPLDATLLTIARSLEDQIPGSSCVISVHGAEGAPATRGVGVRPAHYDAWSTPILSSDGESVLGSFEIFSPEPGDPDDTRSRLFVLLARLASVAIERKAFEEQLAHQSVHDSLTGLPNRLLFLDRLGQSIARSLRTGKTIGVVFLDLDRFKNVNDSLGHDAGDALLVAVARKLESVVRPGDTVARFGGDEFTVLCEDLSPETARDQVVEFAERLLSTVVRPLVVRGTEMFVDASVGIALSSSGEERPEELLRDADAAMHHAKDACRGRIEFFDDAIRARAVTAHATENALHRALERGEFRLFFQPIVGLSDARCVGVEALVRWQHPERGLLAPAEFVPLAEETGQVVQIGWWVLEEAASNAARWQLEQSESFLMAINLSARQLAHPELAQRVADVIAETGVRPSNLCFEITESTLMDDADLVVEAITRVRALGVKFAIDDFGTGYSSLGYLKRFPVDSVKIDRSFVSGLGSDPGDTAIVSAVIGLSHALGLRVTAEGIETEEQLTELIALECDEGQGYFFSPPQPAPDLRSLIARTRTWRPPGAGVMRPAGGLRRRPS